MTTQAQIQAAATQTLPLSPMACRILIFMLLLQKFDRDNGEDGNRSFTTRKLMSYFGKARNTIKTAIANLETVGFIQNNGKANGWSLPASHFQASLFAGEPPPDSKESVKKLTLFNNEPQKSVKILTLSGPSYVVDDLTLNSEREEQQQSRDGGKYQNFDTSGTKQRAQILRQYGVSGRAIRRYSHPPCPETAVILAFCWESATMPLNNPGGWINCRLRDGDEPGDDHLELAQFWLSLDPDGRADFNAAWYSGRPAIDLADDLASEFDLSQAAASLAVELRGLKAFEEAE